MFASLQQKTVFVSCSRDMNAVVGLVRDLISELNPMLPPAERWQVYHWSEADETWDAGGTWQLNIPRPSDPLCGVVVCVLGERVGQPLPASFPLPADLSLPEWVASPGQDASTRVPLTGTVFELVDALSSARSQHGLDRRTLLYLKGDPARILQPDLTFDSRDFGFLHHYDAIRGSARRLTRNQQLAYDQQIEWLDRLVERIVRADQRPFACFGRDGASADECLALLRDRLRADLSKALGVNALVERRFEAKGLQSYDVEDADFLFGRDAEIERIFHRLAELDADPANAPIVALTGRSGEGKSSVLRAGLIGRVRKRRSDPRSGFAAILLAPHEVLVDDPLGMLQQRIEAALKQGDERGNRRLFIGIDQAEELLQTRTEDGSRSDRLTRFWSLLVRLAEDRLAHVVLTLPTTDLPLLEREAPRIAENAMGLTPIGESQVREIVEKTFRSTRVSLDRERIETIIQQGTDWLRGQHDPGPLLPLLSALIRELVKAEQEDRTSRLLDQAVFRKPPPRLEAVLGTLGETAWADASSDTVYDSKRGLQRILRQLIKSGLEEADDGSVRTVVQLRSARTDHPAFLDAPKLVEALRQQRLLYAPSPGFLRLSHVAIVEWWGRAQQWLAADRGNQETLTHILHRASSYARSSSNGGRGEVITDEVMLAKIEDLWFEWRDEEDRLPIDFMRRCLAQAVDRFRQTGRFERSDGGSHLSVALALDTRLSRDWIAALEQVAPVIREAAIKYRSTLTGNSALISAAGGVCDPATVNWLLVNGAGIDDAGNDGWTALKSAATSGRADIVALLVLKGASVNSTGDDEYRWTALHLAASAGHATCVEILLTSPNIAVDLTNAERQTAIHLAAQNGHLAVVDKLLAKTNVDARTRKGVTPLHYAAQSGYAPVVAALLRAEAEMDAATKAGFTPLHMAVLNGNRATVEALLGARSNAEATSKDGTSVLALAVEGGNADVVAAILARLPEEIRKRPPMGIVHLAAQMGRKDLLHLLVTTKEAAESKNTALRNWTPLHFAARFGRDDAVQFLIDAQADCDATGAFGITPLHLAAYYGHEGTFARLLNAGASAERGDGLGRTPDDLMARRRAREEVDGANGSKGKGRADEDASCQETVMPKPLTELIPLACDWQKVPLDDKLQSALFGDGRENVYRSRLPFYESAQLIVSHGRSWDSEGYLACYLKLGDSEPVRLDGSSPPIHQANTKAPLVLRTETVLEYLKFFCFFVRAGSADKVGGYPFYVLTDQRDLDRLLDNAPAHAASTEVVRREAPSQMTGAPAITWNEDKSTWDLTTILSYQNALFRSRFSVHQTGMVEMTDDEPVLQVDEDILGFAYITPVTEAYEHEVPRVAPRLLAEFTGLASAPFIVRGARDPGEPLDRTEVGASIDTIKDFEPDQGDVIDLTDLTGELPPRAEWRRHLRAQSVANGTLLQVRQYVHDEFEDAMVLEGIIDVNLEGLIRSGNIDL